MSRYHTDREIEALAVVLDNFGFALAATMVRRRVRSLAALDPQFIDDDIEGAAEMLSVLKREGHELIWIGPPPGIRASGPIGPEQLAADEPSPGS